VVERDDEDLAVADLAGFAEGDRLATLSTCSDRQHFDLHSWGRKFTAYSVPR